jgi:membrane protein implicated in regulation of membrane protease activity
LILLAGVLLIYILFSYRSLFIELYILLITGIIILPAGLSGPEWYLAAGLFAGAVYISTGLHARYLEKRSE